MIDLRELIEALPGPCSTEDMPVMLDEVELVVRKIFHTLGTHSTFEALAIVQKFTGADNTANLNAFLDEVSSGLDTVSTRITRPKVGRVANVLFGVMENLPAQDLPLLCFQLFEYGAELKVGIAEKDKESEPNTLKNAIEKASKKKKQDH
jgi:hypothetical protein